MTVEAALTRLEDYWNSNDFDADTNPGGLADGGHRQITIGTLRNWDAIMADIAVVAREGVAAGSATLGAIGVVLTFNWDADTADADQGSGKVWIDNATAGSATTVFISDEDAEGVDRSAIYPRFGASTNPVKGFLALVKVADPSAYIYADVTATVDASGYYKLTVDEVVASGGTPFTADDPIVLGFLRAGDKGDTGENGDVVGPESSTNNALAVWSGTGGNTLANSAWLLASGTLNGADNTLTRAALKDTSATVYAISGTSGAITVDHENGHVQTLTATGSCTFTFSNWPPTGTRGWVALVVTNGSNLGAADLDGTNWYLTDGTTTTTFADLGITLGTRNELLIYTDNASTRYGYVS
jgi:hypothetical protein